MTESTPPPVGEKADIKCRHCGVVYVGTARQLIRLQTENRGGFCSQICREAHKEAKRAKPVEYGPCPTCNKKFASKRPKTFCSMKCYTSSEAFKKAARDNLDKAASTRGLQPATMKDCLECGKSMRVKPSYQRRFCSNLCYRNYQAKRFDRWIASPEGISIEQSYDEFLTQERLECPIKGCDWTGHSLSHHMNFTHGVPRDEFKRAAGFNLTTGVISGPLREEWQARAKDYGDPEIAQRGFRHSPGCGYASKESAEHKAKGIALAKISRPEKEKTCPQCETKFAFRHVGHQTYCTTRCREQARLERVKRSRRAKAVHG